MTILEKIQILERYVSVDPSMIDSVLEMAIDKLLKRETMRMGDMHLRINDQVVAFEAEYKMSSEEFRSRYDKGSIGDDMDFIEWAATLDMREKIQRHLSMIHQG
ncbi:MAG: hypothetical protein NTV33_09490 [Coprothermobacterota bacterium]|nr:hypothetical protein [Coprothermobacterota bacterium]